MFLIKTYLDKSPIHGLGVFAADKVSKGTVIWRKAKEIDLDFTPEQVRAMPPTLVAFLTPYVYFQEGRFHFDGDFARHTNHDDNPNSCQNAAHEYYASRDIEAGEEITIDYTEFDQNWPEGMFTDLEFA